MFRHHSLPDTLSITAIFFTFASNLVNVLPTNNQNARPRMASSDLISFQIGT